MNQCESINHVNKCTVKVVVVQEATHSDTNISYLADCGLREGLQSSMTEKSFQKLVHIVLVVGVGDHPPRGVAQRVAAWLYDSWPAAILSTLLSRRQVGIAIELVLNSNPITKALCFNLSLELTKSPYDL